MLLTGSTADLFRACQVLFSLDHPCSIAFLKNLEPSMLKVAYRKKALETHPDRARSLGMEEDDQSQKFREVQMAYEVLLPVAEKGYVIEKPYMDSPFERKPEPQKPGNESSFKPFAQYYQGRIPGHRLKIGHYLYYSGLINWNQLISAVAFQRRFRSKYGEIAVSWNMLNREDIELCMKNKDHDEMIGEYLRREGFLNGFQHLAILGKQRKNHVYFGEYFINEGILTPRQLDIALIRANRHNETLSSFFSHHTVFGKY